MERRLAAIVIADVVGYSRLIREDEAGTLARFQELQEKVFGPRISQHGGRLVKTMGDAYLLEFPSAVAAVEYCADVQQEVSAHEADVAEDRRIRFRVGINVGDIVVDGTDIHGDGVNVAARLESMAEPGGILVSRSVHEQVQDKLDVAFEDMGEVEAKNIDRPVQVFRIAPVKTKGTVPTAKPPRSPRLGLVVGAGVTVLLAFVAGALLWLEPWQPAFRPTLELPDKPSIAVLPFTNLSDDPNQEYFADGMTEDLITDLSKISGLFVIARNSVFAIKGKSIDVRRVAEDLGVRYVLEGSVRRATDRLRINAQLIDATTGGHLWAERYDGTLDEVFTLQDTITEKIVDALSLELTSREAEVVRAIGTKIAAAHDAYLLGLSFYYRHTPEGFKEAKRYFQQAIDLDPDYSAAHIGMAKLYAQGTWLTFSRALGVNNFEAAGVARASLASANAEGEADYHVVRSWLALVKHQHNRAVAEAKRGRALDPNNVDALLALAEALIFSGDVQSGIELAEQAIRQSPAIQAHPLMLLGLAEFVKGNFERAAERVERAFKLGSGKTAFLAILAAARAKVGRNEQAKAALGEFQEGYFGMRDLARVMIFFPFAESTHLEALAEGLLLAGAKVFYSLADGGYMRLTAENQLSGAEIDALLSGTTIEGKGFWNPTPWRRAQSDDGKMVYSGFPYLIALPLETAGRARIEGNLLCEHWPNAPAIPEQCYAIFRIVGEKARTRWGEYVLRTDRGPQPFWVSD